MSKQTEQPGAAWFVSSRSTLEPDYLRGKSRQRRDRGEAKPDPARPTPASEETLMAANVSSGHGGGIRNQDRNRHKKRQRSDPITAVETLPTDTCRNYNFTCPASCCASTTASAVMFTMRRTVELVVRICTGRAAPSSTGPIATPLLPVIFSML
jgi:hypothetical protein